MGGVYGVDRSMRQTGVVSFQYFCCAGRLSQITRVAAELLSRG